MIELASLIFLFVSCHSKEQQDDRNMEVSNNLSITDTLLEDTINEVDNLKSNDENYPISVISASVKVDKYGSGKIYIKFKNTSSKTIDAILFSYEKFNAFKEPLGRTYYNEFSKKMETDNSGTATINMLVNSGKTVTGTVDVNGQDNNLSKIVAKVSKTSFNDGSVWKSSESLILDALSGKISKAK